MVQVTSNDWYHMNHLIVKLTRARIPWMLPIKSMAVNCTVKMDQRATCGVINLLPTLQMWARGPS